VYFVVVVMMMMMMAMMMMISSAHRGLRHHWGLRVRGQHTKTTGRKGRTVGVSKKKN